MISIEEMGRRAKAASQVMSSFLPRDRSRALRFSASAYFFRAEK